MTAVEWLYDKIKSHFEHDGDLFESFVTTTSIAKLKEREQIEEAYNQDLYGGLSGNKKYNNGSDYYTQTYE